MLNLTVLIHMILRPQQSGLHKSTCLFFGLPLPHAIYRKATQSTCAQCDIWGDALLNKSTYAAETRKTTHTLLVQD